MLVFAIIFTVLGGLILLTCVIAEEPLGFLLGVMLFVIGMCGVNKVKEKRNEMAIKTLEVTSYQVDTIITTCNEKSDTTYVIKYIKEN